MDGRIFSKTDQLIDTSLNKEQPETKIQTEIDVPSKGIHQKIIQIPEEPENIVNQHVTRRSPENWNVPVDSENSVSALINIITFFRNFVNTF